VCDLLDELELLRGRPELRRAIVTAQVPAFNKGASATGTPDHTRREGCAHGAIRDGIDESGGRCAARRRRNSSLAAGFVAYYERKRRAEAKPTSRTCSCGPALVRDRAEVRRYFQSK
jgi:hypothetical protein